MRSWIPALLWNWAAPWQAGGSLRGEGLVVAGGGSSTPPGDSGGSAATATICTPWRIGSSLDPAAGQSNFCRGIKVEMGIEFIDIGMGQGVVAPFGDDLAPNFDSWSNAGHFNSPDPVLPDCRSAPPRSRP
jgi:hypothetical protein